MNSEELFTGERFVPGIHDNKLEIEHFQRYLSAHNLVRGKIVLDAACGEGYGSNILAKTAQKVIGIDIDEGAVRRAQTTYSDKSNLTFQRGTIENLDISDHSIDVVVSFETIEHVSEEVQRKFLNEIDRVLKPNGILVMSTPNKRIYSDLHNYKNEFHIKEFYHDEFIGFLHKKFEFIKLYNQSFQVMSIIEACDQRDENIACYCNDKNYNEEGKYYIAIASHRSQENITLSSLYVDNYNEYEENIGRILTLQKEEEARNQHIKELDAEIEEKGQRIFELQKENEERNKHIAHLDAVIEQNGEMIRGYQKELEDQKHINQDQTDLIIKQANRIVQQTEQLTRQSDDVSRYAELSIRKTKQLEFQARQIERLNEENCEQGKIIEKQKKIIQENVAKEEEYQKEIAELQQEKQEKIAELQQESQAIREKEQEYQKEIAELQQENQEKIAELQQESQAIREKEQEYQKEIAELQQTVRNKEGHIELLLESERAYERDKNTHSYKMAKRMQKFGDFLLPPNSKRRFLLRVLFNLFRHPILMLRVINPTRISNYFRYAKNGDIAGIKRGFQNAVMTEKMGMAGLQDMPADVDVKPVQQSAENVIDISEYEKLRFNEFDNPTVSIIIPVYNEFDYTYRCLQSILQHSSGVTYEIIIADDCSTDATSRIGEIVDGINVIRNQTNLRFLLNCNHAAKKARGKYILFLNNDTQVQENWLQPLVDLIERDESIGMVGSKLVYPDGYLQEAGGILWKDASAWNYGNRKSPDDSEFNYIKEVDYISGAAIMIKKSLWKEIGGFDERFAPAYCEDSDLAFEVRAHGYKVMYQPLSVVVHFEGISNGTDTSNGQKAYQIKNQQKFYEKWKDVLEKEHFPNAENVFAARDRSQKKPVLLMVDHYVPQYDKDAGSRTVFQYLKMFVDQGYNVKFIGDNFFRHEPYTTTLQQMGIEVLYGPYYAQNWQDWINENASQFKYVFLNRPHISVKYIDFIRENTNARIMYYGHDLHFLREMRKYELTHDKQALEDSAMWKEKEFDLMKKADVVYYPSNVEEEEIRKIDSNINVKAIVAYIFENVQKSTYNFAQRKDIMFVGGFTHTPNVDAVLWFAKEIFPKIVEKIPEIKWYVMGSNPPQEVLDLANDNIIIKGYVTDEELEQFYQQCRMSIVPLRYGAGIKGKVIEAIRYGIPVVTTSVGAEGIDEAEDILCIEDHSDELANQIVSKYNDKKYLQQVSLKSYEYIKNNFSQRNAWNIIRDDFS